MVYWWLARLKNVLNKGYPRPPSHQVSHILWQFRLALSLPQMFLSWGVILIQLPLESYTFQVLLDHSPKKMPDCCRGIFGRPAPEEIHAQEFNGLSMNEAVYRMLWGVSFTQKPRGHPASFFKFHCDLNRFTQHKSRNAILGQFTSSIRCLSYRPETTPRHDYLFSDSESPLPLVK